MNCSHSHESKPGHASRCEHCDVNEGHAQGSGWEELVSSFLCRLLPCHVDQEVPSGHSPDGSGQGSEPPLRTLVLELSRTLVNDTHARATSLWIRA